MTKIVRGFQSVTYVLFSHICLTSVEVVHGSSVINVSKNSANFTAKNSLLESSFNKLQA